MTELNRQVLINLHNSAGTPTAAQLEYGEIAVVHSDVTTATIYTKVSDDTVAKFITDLAVDAKIKTVTDELTAHKSEYSLIVSELEDAIEENTQTISTETQARKDADDALGTRLTEVETLLGNSDTDDSILDRLSAVEAKASENGQAISDEAATRATEDGKLSTAIENAKTDLNAAISNETQARESADTQIRTDFAAADTQIRTDFAAADAQIRTDFAAADTNLLGKNSDESDAETIWGAKNAAADALTAAQDAQTDATQALANAAAAQATADEAKGKIDSFLLDADLTEKAVDTLREIQNYITSDGKVAADMLEAIEANKQAAATAQKAANEAQAHSEGVAGDLESEVTRAKAVEKANADAITAETQARKDADNALKGTSDDAVSAVTIWGAKNAAAAAQEDAKTNKTKLENLSAAVVKTAEITGVGLGHTETITGLVSGNKLTFDFSNLVIDCGTF